MTTPKRFVMAMSMLILISIPACLFLFWKAEFWVIHYEMREKLKHSHLQTIEIPAASVQWFEEDEEIIADGKLFDVQSYHNIPGTVNISFTGLFDEAETEIEDKLKRLLQQQQSETNDPGKELVAWLFFGPLQETEMFSHHYVDTGKKFSHPGTDNLLMGDLSIPTPPPKA
jgi:hypothetical protein